MAEDLLSKTPLSALELAIITEGATAAQTYQDSLNLAQHLESWNYKRFWLAEHHNMEGVASSATVVLIGYIAGGTENIRVGSGGIMLPNHAPLVVAEQFGTLASLYPSRIDLGLGRAPGTDGLTASALRRDFMQAAGAFPQTVQELQTYLSAANSSSRVRAIPGEGLDIPVWILGSSTDSAKLAGLLGLPYAFASHFAPAQLHHALQLYHDYFRPSAQLQKPYTMACVNVFAANNSEEAAYLATSFYQFALGIVTGKREKLKPPVASMKEVWTDYEAAAVHQMATYTFMGNEAEVKTGLNEFLAQTGVNELMIATRIWDHQKRLRSYELLRNYAV